MEQRVLLAATPLVGFENAQRDAMIGETHSFSVGFENAGTDTGYGPFVDLIVPRTGADGDDGFRYVRGSAQYLDASVREFVVAFDENGEARHPLAKDSNGNAVVVNGNAGDELVVLELPFGSFVDSQPHAAIDFELNLSEQADVGTDLQLLTRGGFHFGEDPLNNPTQDPSVVGDFAAAAITPSVFELETKYLGSENETATGPNFVRRYRIDVDIADGQTIDSLLLQNTLANNVAFLSVDSATPSGGVTIVETPEVGKAADDGVVGLQFDSLIGSAADVDASVVIDFFTPDVDSDNTAVINAATGDDADSVNTIVATGNWTPTDSRDVTDGGGPVVVSASRSDLMPVQKSVAVQASRSLLQDKGTRGVSPGDTLEYTLEFQVSDYFAFDSIVLSDTLSDGQRFDSSFTPQFSVTEHGRTVSGGFSTSSFDVVDHWTGAESAVGPIDGTTDVGFRLSDELVARGFDPQLLGGLIRQGGNDGAAFDASVSNAGATTGRITFRTVVQQEFSDDAPSGDRSVDAGDLLRTNTTVNGRLLSVDDLAVQAERESDTSGTATRLAWGSLTKSLYAINGNTNFGDAVVAAGDVVTYRIQRDYLSSDFEDAVLTDYLPLPVFSAGEVIRFDDRVDASVPELGTAKFGPTETLRSITGEVPVMSVDGGGNSIAFDYGSFDDNQDRHGRVDLLYTVKVSDEPFADGLFLTSQTNSQQGSTNGGTNSQNAIQQIKLTQPVLEITKGVTATDNSAGKFTRAKGPGGVEFSVPGQGKAFAGTIDSTGLGDRQVDSNLTNIDAGDRITMMIVIENTGTGLNGAFDVRVNDQIPAGFEAAPEGINLRATYGNGDAIAFEELSGGLFGDGLELVDSDEGGAIAAYDQTSGRNVVVIAYDLISLESVEAGRLYSSTAKITNFAGIESGPDHTVSDYTDQARVRIARPDIDKNVVSTSQNRTGSSQHSSALIDAAIGETVTYDIVVTVPEGVSTISIVDQLPVSVGSMELVDSRVISVGSNLDGSSLNVGDAGVHSDSSDADSVSDRVVFDFGRITNPADGVVSESDQITVQVTGLVLDAVANTNGLLLKNTAIINYGTGIGTSVATVEVVEPELSVVKTVSSSQADATDKVHYSVVLSHATNSTLEAFDITIDDLLNDPRLDLIAGTVTTTRGDIRKGNGPSDTTVAIAFDELGFNDTAVIEFDAFVNEVATPGDRVVNTATATWDHIAGDGGRVDSGSDTAVVAVNSSAIAGSVNVIGADATDGIYDGLYFNVVIDLFGIDHLGNQIERTTTTDFQGNYAFEDLRPGTYRVSETQPPIVHDGADYAGQLGGDVANDVIDNIVVSGGSNGVYRGYDFVELAPATLFGAVYIDANMDGTLQDDEEGVSGVVVTLDGIDDRGDAVSVKTQTDADGSYKFSGLRPGDYSVTESQPQSLLDADDETGSHGGVVEDDVVSSISLSAGEVATGYNFGEYTSASLNGIVFLDSDRDLSFDNIDSGLASVPLSLSGTDDRGNYVDVTIETNDDGEYSFDGLRPGNYSINVGQIDEYTNGRDLVGTFLGHSDPIVRNGVNGDDVTTEIQIRQGEVGYNYNFTRIADHACNELATDFVEVVEFKGTNGVDNFEFRAGHETHTVILNGLTYELDASVATDVVFSGRDGDDVVTLVGTPCIDRAELRSGSAKLTGSYYRARVYRSTDITIDSAGGDMDRAYFYGTTGDDKYRAVESRSRMWNDHFENDALNFDRTYAYGQGGSDRAWLYDTAASDTFKATPENARLYGGDHYAYTSDFDRVYAYSTQGGRDKAQFWDSEGADRFKAEPTQSRMYGAGFYNYARNFGSVVAYATAGGNTDDRAYLYDSPGDEVLLATPTAATLVGDRFSYETSQFDRVYSYAKAGGDDTAHLYDSHGLDRFVANPTSAKLYGAGFYNDTSSFDTVHAYASAGGNDRAYFNDSNGDDTFVAAEESARMFGDGFNNVSHGFARTYATATSGNDTLYLQGNTVYDTLKVDGQGVRLFNADYYRRATGFGQAKVVFSELGDHKRGLLFGSELDDSLTASGDESEFTRADVDVLIHRPDGIRAVAGAGWDLLDLQETDIVFETIGEWIL